jgi:hypothetical protein
MGVAQIACSQFGPPNYDELVLSLKWVFEMYMRRHGIALGYSLREHFLVGARRRATNPRVFWVC